MPTTRPRHTLTETDELAAALDAAAVAWPDLRGDRTALLRRLVTVGSHSVLSAGNPESVIRDAAGVASGTYPRDARAELLSEWPP
ncbi:MAG: hypothetical protein ACOH19_10715 [Rhodoglobus sp.]